MRLIIFAQRITIFTNSFVTGYSVNNEKRIGEIISVTEKGAISGMTIAFSPSPFPTNQILEGSPWFVKSQNFRVVFQPTQIDIILEQQSSNEQEEQNAINEAVCLMEKIMEVFNIDKTPRIAYSPSIGIYTNKDINVSSFIENVINLNIPDGTSMNEFQMSMNFHKKISLGGNTDVVLNRLLRMNEGVLTEERILADGTKEVSKSPAIIITLDINTAWTPIQFSKNDIKEFFGLVTSEKKELLEILPQ